MLQDQLRCGILIALIAVGLFWRGMLRQQNNEGPSSHNFSPASTDSANLQHKVIQADGADNSNLGEVQPNIQQDKANQNNEGPSSSHNFGPASLQHNDIQADGADDSNFDQTPKVRVVQSNIQQDKAYLQYNAIRANSAKKSNFNQRPIAEKVTQDEANWKDLLRGIIALIAGLFLATWVLAGLFNQLYAYFDNMFVRLSNVLGKQIQNSGGVHR